MKGAWKNVLHYINIWYLWSIRKGQTEGSLCEKTHDSCDFSSDSTISHLSSTISSKEEIEKASACAAAAPVNIVYAVYEPPHKQVNAGRIKCLWLYFRHLQYTILWGLLSTGKRTWLSLDIPVLRKPHLIRSRGCEETDRAAKALKNRPVNWLSDVTGFSVHHESTQGQIRSIYKPCQMTGRCG